MRRSVVAVGLLAVFLSPLALQPARPVQPAKPAREEPLVDRVRRAIEDGVRFLKTEQHSGKWDETLGSVPHPGGSSSLALLALLNAGVPRDDRVIQDGLKYLRTLQQPSTYV